MPRRQPILPTTSLRNITKPIPRPQGRLRRRLARRSSKRNSKGKRQNSKGKSYELSFRPFAFSFFCLLPFAFVMTLAELAQFLNVELRGDGGIEITGAASLDRAREGDVTYLADAARLEQPIECKASALIIPAKLASEPILAGRSLLIARDAKLAFARVIDAFHRRPYVALGVSSDLAIGRDSRFGID